MLVALKEFTQHPDYQKLSAQEKYMGKIFCLLHDISKEEGEGDPGHPLQSSIEVYSMLRTLNMPKLDKDRIAGLIKHHYWSGDIACGTKSPQAVAYDCREPGDFEIEKIFEYADIKAGGEASYERFKGPLEISTRKAQPAVDEFQSTETWLPQTKLPKASELDNKYLRKIDGIDGPVKVVNINEFKNFTGLIYAVPENFDKKQAKLFDYMGKESSGSVLSSSFVTKDNFHTFGNAKHGYVLNVAPGNILATSSENMVSGFVKGLDETKEKLFDKNNLKFRNYRTNFSNAVTEECKKQGYKPDYTSIIRKLSQMQTQDMNGLIEQDPKLDTIIDSAINKSILNHHDSNNETLLHAAKTTWPFSSDPNKLPSAIKEDVANNREDIAILEVT